MTTTRQRRHDLPPQVTTGQFEPTEAAEGDLWVSYWYNVSYLRTDARVAVWRRPSIDAEPVWDYLS